MGLGRTARLGVNFLQPYDIRAALFDDLCDASGIATPVQPHALVNVVGQDRKKMRTRASRSLNVRQLFFIQENCVFEKKP